ncbi:MAG TPA: signal peptidase I [Bacteroidales bacterium]|nr:signal peptidase I [Bacteroidales bacterium]
MKIRQWILILFGASLLALTIRIFLFDTIRVASNAMSDSQQAGDRLLVEKWSLGARMPISMGIPFVSDSLFGKKSYLSLGETPMRCLGFGAIKRNDLLAYNDPTTTQNIDRSPIQLSRCVGLPGEHFILKKGKTIINGKKVNRPLDVSFCYSYPLSNQKTLLQVIQACKFNHPVYQNKDSGFVYLTRHEWLCLYRIKNQIDLGLKLRFSSFDEMKIRIPAKGTKIEMNDSTFRLYGKLINRYEGVTLSQDTAGNVLKNGRKIRFHTFKENYYLLLNDHQGYLNDSRSSGLLPERFIIGKAWMLLFSPSRKRFLEKI